MTGAAILCFQQWNQSSQSTVRKALPIARDVKFKYNEASADLYAHYYYTQAMINRGGSDWTNYNAKFSQELLLHQSENGSWPSPGGGKKLQATAPTYTNGSYALHYRIYSIKKQKCNYLIIIFLLPLSHKKEYPVFSI